MALSPLPNWLPTAHGLHAGAQLVGAIRKLVTPRQPLFLHLGLIVTTDGLSSGRLPAGGELWLELYHARLAYRAANGSRRDFVLAGRSPHEVTLEVLAALAEGDLHGFLAAPAPDRAALAAAFAAREIPAPDFDVLFGTAPAMIDGVAAAAYARTFNTVHAALARFRAGLRGMQSPLVVWPHHFDLSGLWFVHDELDDYKPHLNFGFAPYSPGLDQPYVYVTAYPLPDDLEPPALPDGAYWHSEGWRGVVIPYAALAHTAEPEFALWAQLQAIYERMRPLLPLPAV